MAVFSEHVSVEPMHSSDLDAVHRLDRLCFPTPWLDRAFQTELSNRAADYFVARNNSDVVGYGGYWLIMEVAHFTTVAVHPCHQGRNIGLRLMLAMFDEAILKGAKRAALEVREGNVSAQSLYHKFGFYQASLRKNYYTDNGENALIMWAEAIQSTLFRQRLLNVRQSLYS